MDVLTRFILLADFGGDEDDCVEWLGTRTKGGYGMFSIGGRKVPAHRASYELFRGKIPEGLEIDHLCLKTWCVNPGHLEAVTHVENMRRFGVLTTYCSQGHEYSEDNTYRSPGTGRRHCRSCNNVASREYRARKR